MQGFITKNISNLYHVKTDSATYKCSARGKFKNEDITPVVGDTVEIEVINESSKEAIITKIEERISYIKRPKVANISQMICVLSTNMPKPDLLLLDKQLAFAEYLNIKPVIVINKLDIDKKEYAVQIEKLYTAIGYNVIITSAIFKKGIEHLMDVLKNNISVFSGNSGVGKSTLINSIFRNQITKEGRLSDKSKRGKNTTTHVELYEIDTNSYIADTPGFSTFDIYEISYKELDKYFIEFGDYIPNCGFVGCTHVKEEACGVKEAVQSNRISQERYDRYVKIYQDLKEREENKW